MQLLNIFWQSIIISKINLALSFDLKIKSCGSYLSVSPLHDTFLQINWDFTCESPPDVLKLVYKFQEAFKILQEHIPKTPFGNVKSKISFGYDVILPGGWNGLNVQRGPKCFPYYLGSYRNGSLIDESCLKIEPTWMEQFGELLVGDMMLPGTHNSGAYKGMPRLLKNYVLNQDRDIWTQLVFGIRYFDLRIGYHNKFYLNHNIIKCIELEPELRNIALFVNVTKTEVVVLDFHEFYSFNYSLHHRLIELIQDTFGNKIYFPYNLNLKIKELWNMGKNVIIYYSHAYDEPNWVSIKLSRFWPNVHKVEDFEAYLQNVYTGKNFLLRKSHVLMAEMTPTSSQRK